MIEPKGNCPTCGAPDTFLTAANEWRDMARQAQDEVSRAANILDFLAKKGVRTAGEDYPFGFYTCVWCGIVERNDRDFHRPECPVVKARAWIKSLELPGKGV